MATIKITLTRSLIGKEKSQRLTADALGLGKVGSSVTQEDSAPIMGMIRKITHALTVTREDGTVLSSPPVRIGRKHLYGPQHGPLGIKK